MITKLTDIAFPVACGTSELVVVGNLIISEQRAMMREAREYYKVSDDVEGTLRRLPRHMVAERAIVCFSYYQYT